MMKQKASVMTQHRRCPFCGSSQQTALPYEVQVEQASGKYMPKIWRVVLCNCGVTATPGRTEKQAWANWDKRSKDGNLPRDRRAFVAHQAAIRNSGTASAATA